MSPVEKLTRIYEQVPEVHCKGLCYQNCSIIPVTEVEHAVIAKRHGSPPEAIGIICDKLKNGRCTIYADRPLICRLFGAVKGMRCPFGCTPKQFLSQRDAYKLLDECEAIKPGDAADL
jgi:uncharacterized protein